MVICKANTVNGRQKTTCGYHSVIVVSILMTINIQDLRVYFQHPIFIVTIVYYVIACGLAFTHAHSNFVIETGHDRVDSQWNKNRQTGQ